MKKETNHNKVKIIPLGGLEQIGMNMTAFEYEDSIIVVDCGMAFRRDRKERRAGADVRQYQRDPSGIYDVGAHRRQDL